MKKYRYFGPIYCNGHPIAENHEAVTSAKSKQKAISNILYRIRKQHFLGDRDRLSLEIEKLSEIP